MNSSSRRRDSSSQQSTSSHKSGESSFYTLGNNSSGTLRLKNAVSRVEFTNVRPEDVPSSPSKPAKHSTLKRLITKVRPHSERPELPQLATAMSPKLSLDSTQNPKLSPLARSFSRDEPRVSFSDRLRQLNASTKYKSYNLIKTKRDKAPKADSSGNTHTDRYPLLDTYLGDYSIEELESMLNNRMLGLKECEEYAIEICNSIKSLCTPMFQGEHMKYSLEDMTKLVGIYVKLRLLQEELSGNNSTSYNTTAIGAGFMDDLQSPSTLFAEPPQIGTGSAGSLLPGSPLDPLLRVHTNHFNADYTIREDFLDLMKHLMTIMINQLYYDEFKQEINFIRGTNPLLTKRRNTLSSYNSSTLHHGSFASSIGPDLNSGAHSVIDIPIMPSSRSTMPATSLGGTIFPNSSTTPTTANFTINTPPPPALTNLGMLPLGTFERCSCLLWRFFETNAMYESMAMFLPIELELAYGHQMTSMIHSRANRIKYGSSYQISGIIPNKTAITTYTNTLIHPEYFRPSKQSPEPSYGKFIGDSGEVENDLQYSKIGVLGEYSSINIKEWILQAYRDYVVIPLYELNRNYEEVDGIIDSLREDFKLEQNSLLDRYFDASVLKACFGALSGIDANDTNQRLVENLLDQMSDRCAQLEALARLQK